MFVVPPLGGTKDIMNALNYKVFGEINSILTKCYKNVVFVHVFYKNVIKLDVFSGFSGFFTLIRIWHTSCYIYYPH